MTEDGRQKADDRGWNYFEFRISKPGTRPKGWSPKDNCELKEGVKRRKIQDA